MVRLGDWRLNLEKTHLKRFNSSMVRLGVNLLSISSCATQVSIPVWCDWELLTTSWNLYLPSFNSSMVRLGESSHILQPAGSFSFNSSMVRLGAWIKMVRFSLKKVSIPVWCDWEQRAILRYLFRLCFNSSMVRLGVNRRTY